jgi:hypothetical protein
LPWLFCYFSFTNRLRKYACVPEHDIFARIVSPLTTCKKWLGWLGISLLLLILDTNNTKQDYYVFYKILIFDLDLGMFIKFEVLRP